MYTDDVLVYVAEPHSSIRKLKSLICGFGYSDQTEERFINKNICLFAFMQTQKNFVAIATKSIKKNFFVVIYFSHM